MWTYQSIRKQASKSNISNTIELEKHFSKVETNYSIKFFKKSENKITTFAFEVPGGDKDSVKLFLQGNKLTVSHEHSVFGNVYSKQRSVILNDNEIGTMTARLLDGMLYVAIDSSKSSIKSIPIE